MGRVEVGLPTKKTTGLMRIIGRCPLEIDLDKLRRKCQRGHTGKTRKGQKREPIKLKLIPVGAIYSGVLVGGGTEKKVNKHLSVIS